MLTATSPSAASPRILPLSAEAVSQLNSSRHLTSLQAVIQCLCENSLDACATRIEISVDWRRGNCTIDDNGHGIAACEFAENGGLARMYCTSKRAPVGAISEIELYGSTGTFLAELANLSLLTLASHHASLTIHHGRVIVRKLPGPETAGSSQPVGTNISVRNLFGNMPVRVKQRTLTTEDGSGDDRPWSELRRGIAGLLLAWPKTCSVRIRDANIDSKLVSLSGRHPSVSSALTEKSLRNLAGKRTSFDLGDALPILFQAGLAPPESRQRWIPLAASTAAIALKGLICLDPSPTKNCQLIAIGIRPCLSDKGHNELFDAVNKVFSNSSFGVTEDSTEEVAADGGNAADSKLRRRPTGRLQGLKSVDRHPMYYIQLFFRDRVRSSPNIEQMNDASLKLFVDILEAAVTAWLDTNHFRPRSRRSRQRGKRESHALSASLSSRPSRPPTPVAKYDTSTDFPYTSLNCDSGTLGSGTNERHENGIPPQQEYSVELRSLSRIRVGSAVNTRQKVWSSKDSTLEPLKDDTLAHEHNTGAEEALHVPPVPLVKEVEASEFNHCDLDLEAELKPSITRGILDNDSAANHRQDVESTPMSEDFGSFDHVEMIASAESFENTSPADLGVVHSGKTTPDGVVTWTDPTSKEVFQVNSRTGVVLPSQTIPVVGSASKVSIRQRAAIDTKLSPTRKPTSLSRRTAMAATEVEHGFPNQDSKWLPGFLKEWNNPVFAMRKEEEIPAASFGGPRLLGVDEHGNCCPHGISSHDFSGRKAVEFETKLSKAALKNATVINQVDRKFILCMIPSASANKTPAPIKSNVNDMLESHLVLIDQHAASERIILESLLSSLFAPPTSNETTLQIATTLLPTQKPINFEISAHETALFRKHTAHFQTWGIAYSLQISSHRLQLLSLPTAIARRCTITPSLAIDLLRTEVWALEVGSKKPLLTVPTTTTAIEHTSEHTGEDNSPPSPAWLKILPHLPTRFLEMLHSRACRSAVMFNDVLSKAECEELVKQVADCVFPFICAHGRVGMVPFGQIGGDGELSEIGRGCRKFGVGVEEGGWRDRERVCRWEDLGKWMGGATDGGYGHEDSIEEPYWTSLKRLG